MAAYRRLPDPTAFLRTADDVVVQSDPTGRNADYIACAAWMAAGNTPDPIMSTLPSQAAAALATRVAAGIAITSSATPTLNGTYALDDASTAEIYQIGLYASQIGTFPSGGMTLQYPDASSVPHSFSTAQFVAFLQAVAALVSSLQTQAAIMGAGGTPAWPTQTASIS